MWTNCVVYKIDGFDQLCSHLSWDKLQQILEFYLKSINGLCERIIILRIKLMILTNYALTYRVTNCNKSLNFIINSIKSFANFENIGMFNIWYIVDLIVT